MMEEECDAKQDQFHDTWSAVGFERAVEQAVQNIYAEFQELRRMVEQIHGLLTKEAEPENPGGQQNEQPEKVEPDEKFKFVCDLFQKAAPGWAPTNDFMLDAVNEICEYEEAEIQNVFKHAGESGINRNSLLNYVRKGLENYERLYEGGGPTVLDYDKIDEAKKEIAELELDIQAAEDKPVEDYEIVPGIGMSKTQEGTKDWVIRSLREQLEGRKRYVGEKTGGANG